MRLYLERMKFGLSALFLGLALSVSAQTSPTDADQGQYVRRSVSHLGMICVLDGARSMPPAWQEDAATVMRDNFRLPRFDDNPLPDSVIRTFRYSLGNYPDAQTLREAIRQVLAPRIAAIVQQQSMTRAATLRSSAQLNSKMADKMKSQDITGDQVLLVMNSAWLYVPVIERVTVAGSRNDASVNVSMALLWYHLSLNGTDTGVELAQVLQASGSMVAARARHSHDAEAFCFQSAVESCARQLLQKTRAMPVFNLSGQVMEAGWQKVWIDLGKNDGASTNDLYRLMENVEGKDGQTRASSVGWIRVTGTDDSAKNFWSQAHIISGSPYAGLALQEIPLSSWTLTAGYLGEAVNFDGESGCLQGAAIDGFYMPRMLPGFSLGLGLEYMGASFSEADVSVTGLRFALHQSLPLYRRLSLFAEPEVSFRYVMAGDDTSGSDKTFQAGAMAGLELSLTPGLSLAGGVGVSAFDAGVRLTGEMPDGDGRGSSPTVNLRNDGIKFMVRLQWTPPSLSVSPADLLLGSLGW